MFVKDGFKIEKFIHKRLPLFAKATENAKHFDTKLAEYFENDGWRKFDGVVFYPKFKEVYCSFYDDSKKCAVLISAIDLRFKNMKVQKQVNIFKNKYYGNK